MNVPEARHSTSAQNFAADLVSPDGTAHSAQHTHMSKRISIDNDADEPSPSQGRTPTHKTPQSNISDAEYDYRDSPLKSLAPDQESYLSSRPPMGVFSTPSTASPNGQNNIPNGFQQQTTHIPPRSRMPRRPHAHLRTGSAIVFPSPPMAAPLPVVSARQRSGSLSIANDDGVAIQTAFGPSIFSSGWSPNIVAPNRTNFVTHDQQLGDAASKQYGIIGERPHPVTAHSAEDITAIRASERKVAEENVSNESARSLARTLDYLGLDDASNEAPPKSVMFGGGQEEDEVAELGRNPPKRSLGKQGYKTMPRLRPYDHPGHGRSRSFSIGMSNHFDPILGGSPITPSNPSPSIAGLPHTHVKENGLPNFVHRRAAYETHRPRAISLGFIEPPLDLIGTHGSSSNVSPEKRMLDGQQLGGPSAGPSPLSHPGLPLHSHPALHRRQRSAIELNHAEASGILGVHRQLFATGNADDALGLTVPDVYTHQYGGREDDDLEADLMAAQAEQQHLAALAALQNVQRQQQQLSNLHALHGHLSEERIHPQIPTRSLWIGTIDATLSAAELLSHFSSFGPIESLRMLPEKECAFINYARVEDAIVARDEMQGARVGSCIVRVGFGRAEGLEHASAVAAAAAAAAVGGAGTQASRALWVGNISPSTNPAMLAAIFAPYGTVESCRVLTHKNCGFVNYERIEDAVRARRAMHGQEIGGLAIRIGFAKAPSLSPLGSASPTLRPAEIPGPSRMRSTHGSTASFSGVFDHTSPLSSAMTPSQFTSPYGSMSASVSRRGSLEPLTVEPPPTTKTFLSPWFAWGDIGEEDGDENEEVILARASKMLAESIGGPIGVGAAEVTYSDPERRMPHDLKTYLYASTVPPIPEPKLHRKVDQPRLRELRKRLDAPPISYTEIESAFHECYDDCVELCSDYIGNTVVQKLAERCDDDLTLRLIQKVSPHFAAIGVHKNGTWAVQKIINCAKTESQLAAITEALRQYAPPLLLDQFGNYVVQCCLRLGSSFNQFIFEAMHVRCWDIAQGRYGARAMRTCLESQFANRRQQKLVAISIVEHALELATNPNGSILLTWLLDTSQLPGRYILLAPRLADHLGSLCVHKLASLMILKIINQRQENEARELLLSKLFPDVAAVAAAAATNGSSSSGSVLEEVLRDQTHGVALVQKCLASQVLEGDERAVLSDRVRNALVRMDVSHIPCYKRLAEEVGAILPSPSSNHHLSPHPSHPSHPGTMTTSSSTSSPASEPPSHHSQFDE